MTQPTWEGPIPTSGRQRRGVLAPVLGLIALGICGLVVLGLVASSVGVGGVVVGALCALLPVGPVVASFLWIDRWEPEPPRLLLLAFLWGACFAALSALVINSSAALIADEVLGRGSGDVVGAVAVAPIVEEAVKGAFLVGLLIFRRREFDGIVDGIVYAGLVAAGFAFTENILYFGRAFTEDGPVGQAGGVFAVLVLRGVLSPFAHPLFTAMTGIGAGIAVEQPQPAGPGARRADRLRAGGHPARAVERLGVAAGRRGLPRGLRVHHGAAVPGHDRRGGLAAAPRAADRDRPAARFRAGRLDRAQRDHPAVQPGRAARLARRGPAALGQAGGQGGHRLPGRGHRPGVPAVPDGPRIGGRETGGVLARRGPRRAGPRPATGRSGTRRR